MLFTNIKILLGAQNKLHRFMDINSDRYWNLDFASCQPPVASCNIIVNSVPLSAIPHRRPMLSLHLLHDATLLSAHDSHPLQSLAKKYDQSAIVALSR